jgi:hypothetical protein|tara:strand:- start:872 stop:1543 length:672 start_codon:yes stop_codon:yes gene_type:complete
MASSGQTTFDLAIDDVIEQAFEQIGGQPISGEEARSARIALNLLLTEWQNRGVLLWKLVNTPVTVTTSVTSYTLDSDIIDSLQTTINVNGNDLEMNRITYQDYMKLPDKTQTGRPTQFSFLRGKDNVSMTVWPTPDQTYTMNLFTMTRIQDVTASAIQTADLPFRFLPALVDGLAYKMSMRRPGVDPSKISFLKQQYEETFAFALEEDRQRTSMFIRPRLGSL